MKFKKLHENAKLPVRSTPGAAGYDIFAVSEEFLALPSGPVWQYHTGIACEIPEGWVGQLCPRSSITKKTTFMLGNSIGQIDSDYRGEIILQFRDVKPVGFMTKKFDLNQAIAQLIVVPYLDTKSEWVEELSVTNRGTGAFGSTDKK